MTRGPSPRFGNSGAGEAATNPRKGVMPRLGPTLGSDHRLIVIVVIVSVLQLDAVDDAPLSCGRVVDLHRRAGYDPGPDVRFRNDGACGSNVAHRVAVVIGDRAGLLLHDEGRSGHI